MNIFLPFIDVNELPHYESFDCVPKDYVGPCYVVEDRAILWREKGKAHNTNGPAVIWPPIDNSSQYYGYKYCINGQLHRLDGPAYSYSEPNIIHNKLFYIHGKEFEKEKFWNHPLVIKNILQMILSETD